MKILKITVGSSKDLEGDRPDERRFGMIVRSRFEERQPWD